MITIERMSTIALELETPETVFVMKDMLSGTRVFLGGTHNRFGLACFLSKEATEVAIQKVIRGAWLRELAILEPEEIAYEDAVNLAASKPSADGVWILDSMFREINWQWVK